MVREFMFAKIGVKHRITDMREQDYEALMQSAIRRARELKKGVNREVRELRRKRRKFLTFKRKKLGRLCIHFVAGELEPVEKLLQELREIKEGIDSKSVEGRACLRILEQVNQES